MLDILLADGFGYHATESERLAGELEAAASEARETPGQWAPFLKLATHTIGEHLGDWPRARQLAEKVLEGRAASAETAKAWAHLSIARLMSGEIAAALEAELAYLAASTDLRAALIEARFMLVATLVGCRRASEAALIYQRALDLARELGQAAPHRAVAVASANLATELLEAPSRTVEEAVLMGLAADASHEFWLECGTWENNERGHYLKALVANVAGEPTQALAHVDQALAIIAANGEEPIDDTFLHLTRAHALRLLGDAAGSAAALAYSDAAAAAWEKAGLRDWYAEERARVMG